MKAKYYRFMYQNVQGGLCYTGSLADSGNGENQTFHFKYVSGGKTGRKETGNEKETCERGRYHLLILADFTAAAVRRAADTLRECQVDKLIYPYLDGQGRTEAAKALEQTGECTEEMSRLVKEPEEYLKEHGGAACEEISRKKEFFRGNQRFVLIPVGAGRKRSLVLYHESRETSPQTAECVMSVKPVTPFKHCSSFVNPENLNCEMRCMLYEDFAQCKKHNRKNGEYFVDGYLLLGTGSLKEAASAAQEALGEAWRRIRFVGIPEETGDKDWAEELLSVGTKRYAQYFVSGEGLDAEVIRAIAVGNPYRTFFATGEQSGLCISGCYVDRQC